MPPDSMASNSQWPIAGANLTYAWNQLCHGIALSMQALRFGSLVRIATLHAKQLIKESSRTCKGIVHVWRLRLGATELIKFGHWAWQCYGDGTCPVVPCRVPIGNKVGDAM